MQHVGRVIEVWRYPLSSIGGELVTIANIDPAGVAGDRQYALVDAATGSPAAPEREPRWRKALYLRATGHGDTLQLAFPDGSSCALADPALNDRLSYYFGFAAAVATYHSGGLISAFPVVANRYQPFAVHLLTTASLKELASIRGVEAVDSRRFRPTVVIDVAQATGFIESQWIGFKLQLGNIFLTAHEETKRCGMTLVSQPGIDEDAEILRSIMRHNRRNLGIYCTVETAGTVQPGDPLLID